MKYVIKNWLCLMFISQTIICSSIKDRIYQKFCLSQRTLKKFDATRDDQKYDFIVRYERSHYVNSEDCSNWTARLLCLAGLAMSYKTVSPVTALADGQVSFKINELWLVGSLFSCLGSCTAIKCSPTGVFKMPCTDKTPCMSCYDCCTCWRSTANEMYARFRKRKK